MGTRVYVGRLSYDVRERDLEKFFKGYGRIREILMKNGFGFVEFDDYRDADDAVYELNGKELLGERVIVQVARGPAQRNRPFGYKRRTNWIEKVSVEHARGPLRGSDLWGYRNRNWRTPPRRRAGKEKYGPPTRTEYRLIVENLSSRVSWQDLKDFMRQAGEVTYADAHKQRRNEGVVEFASYGDMKTAIEKLDNAELNGRRIRLVEDRPRHRSRSHSRSRSKSRSHSQSRSRSRSRSHSKSRSKSRSRSQSASRSRSKSRSKSPSKSRSRSRSKTPENQSKSGSKSRSPSREKSKSKSKSPSNSPANSPPKSPSKSPSKSPVPEEKSAEEEMDDKD